MRIAPLAILLLLLAGCTTPGPEAADGPALEPDQERPPGNGAAPAPPTGPSPVASNGTVAGHPPVEAQGCDGTTFIVFVERSIIEERLPPGITPIGANPVTVVTFAAWTCDSVIIGNERFATDVHLGMVYTSTSDAGADKYLFEVWTDWDALLDLWRAQGLDPRNASAVVSSDPLRTTTIQGDGIHYVLQEATDDDQDVGPRSLDNIYLAGPRATYAFRHELNYGDDPSVPGTLSMRLEEGFLAETFGPAGAAGFERQTATHRFVWLQTPLEENP